MRNRLIALAFLITAQAHAGMWGVDAQVGTTGIAPTLAELQSVVPKDENVRATLGWHKVERSKGVYAIPPEFAELYANVALAGDHNIVTLAFGNRLYTLDNAGKPNDQALPTTPEAIAAFAKYAAWVVQNVPNLYAVSIWNECNGSFCTGTVPERQANYVALLKATVPAIRAANPSVKIIAGATVGWNVSGWFMNIGKVFDWKQIDYLDLHPYLGDDKPNPLASWTAQLQHIRAAGITNPAYYTEWGGPSAAKMGKGYPAWFMANVAATDPVKPAGATFFTLKATAKFPNQGLIGADGIKTEMGAAFASHP